MPTRKTPLGHPCPRSKGPRLAITLDDTAAPGGIIPAPNQDAELFVFHCITAADNDTFNPGFVTTGRNVVRWAYKLTANATTRTMSGAYSSTTGAFSFDFSAGADNQFDLLVWVK